MADEIIGFDDRGFRRAVKAIREVENHVLQGPPQAPPQVAPLILHAVPFLNNAAEEMPAYGVARITGSTTVNSETMLTADKPGTTFGDSYLVNGEQPVAAGKVGSGYTYDPPFILYDTGTPAAAEGWGPKPGQWSLSKGFPATTSVRELSDSTNKFIEGTLHCIVTALIRFTGSVSNNTSTTSYKIYAGTMGSESDAGFTTVPSARNRTGARVTNDWALLVRVNNGWEIANLATGTAEIYHITIPSPGVAANATISITLPTTEVVTAKNWSACTMDTGDKVTIYKDGDDDNWYLDKSGNCGASGTRWFLATLTGGLSPDSASTTDLGSVIALDDGSVPTISEALNSFELAGETGDLVLICEYAAAAEGYLITQITHKTRSMVTQVEEVDDEIIVTRRTVCVVEGSAGATDTTLFTLEDLTVVTNVYMDGDDEKQTKYPTRTITVGGSPSNSTVWEGTDCP